MRVTMYLRVAWITKINFTWVWDVEDLGVGNVKRSIVVNIMMLQRGRNYRQQKIITIPFVVGKKMALKKKSIVLEVTQDIVRNDGSYLRKERTILFNSSSAFCLRTGKFFIVWYLRKFKSSELLRVP